MRIILCVEIRKGEKAPVYYLSRVIPKVFLQLCMTLILCLKLCAGKSDSSADHVFKALYW